MPTLLSAMTTDKDDAAENATVFCRKVIEEMSTVSDNASFKAQIIVGTSMVLYQSPAHLELEAVRAAIVEEAFKVVDTEETGSVPLSAVQTILGSLHMGEGTDVAALLADDVSDDGQVSFDAYRQLIDSKKI